MNRFVQQGIFFLLAGILNVPVTAHAQMSDFDRITADILANNPDLKMLNAENQAEYLSSMSENNLPDPEIDGQYLFAPRSDSNRWSVGISQSFDWAGSYRAKQRAIDAQASANKLLLQSQCLDLRLRIRNLLIEAIGIKNELELLHLLTGNLNSQLMATENALGRGQATRLDVAKLRFELIKLNDETSLLEVRLTNVVKELCSLNGNSHVDISPIDDYPLMPLLSEQDYLDAFDRLDPFAEATKAEANACTAAAQAARAGNYPGFSLGYVHAFEEGIHFNGITARVTLPLFSNRHKVAEAAMRTEVVRLRLDSYTLTRYAAIRHQLAVAVRLRDQLAEYDEAFRQTDYLGDLDRLLKAGQINIGSYITELNYYLDIRRQYLQTQCEYQLTLNDLNRYNGI